MIQSFWNNNNSHVPKIAYFPRNELAMNPLFVEVCRGCEKKEEDNMENSWPQCGRPAGYSETSWTWHYVLPTSANRYNFRMMDWQTCTPEQIFSFAEKILFIFLPKTTLHIWDWRKIHLQIYLSIAVNKTRQTVRNIQQQFCLQMKNKLRHSLSAGKGRGAEDLNHRRFTKPQKIQSRRQEST